MKIINFVTISTDAKNEIHSDGQIYLVEWTFIDVSVLGGTQQNFKIGQASPPTSVLIKDRMLILYYD